jgi:hypothetical protein
VVFLEPLKGLLNRPRQLRGKRLIETDETVANELLDVRRAERAGLVSVIVTDSKVATGTSSDSWGAADSKTCD